MRASQRTPYPVVDLKLLCDFNLRRYWKARDARTFHLVRARPSHIDGFFLVEAMLVLMIFGVVMAMTTSYASNAYRIFSGIQAASQLRYANDVVQEFVLHYSGEIKTQFSETPDRTSLKIKRGEINTDVPTTWRRHGDTYVWILDGTVLAQIATLLHRPIPHKFSEVRLSLYDRNGDINNCKALNSALKSCRIETLVYRNRSIFYSNTHDWLALNAGFRSLKTGGGLSLSSEPGVIRFNRNDEVSRFSENPAGDHAGILAIRSEQAPQHKPFLDHRYGHMFGKIDIAGSGIKNAKNITANLVTLNESEEKTPAHVSFIDSVTSSKLALNTTGISTGDWKWTFPKVTFNDVNTGNVHQKSDSKTIIENDTVTANKVSSHNVATKTLKFSGTVTTSSTPCKRWDIAFDDTKKPVYCNSNLWTRLAEDSK